MSINECYEFTADCMDLFCINGCFVKFLSFESWFDISTITSDVEALVTNEREQNILNMLHQVKTKQKWLNFF